MNARIDSRALAQFVAVAESMSFRQAAETLHMSQPPLTRAIKGLEERLGVRLFDRDTRSVSLTASGKKLLPRARLILRLIGDAERALASSAIPAKLRLGITNAVDPEWFTAFVKRAGAVQPGVAIVPVSDSSPRLVRLLRRHQLDAAFIALPTESAALDVIELGRQPMVVAMSSAHRLARRKMIRLNELTGEPLFWFERARQPAFFDHCQRVFDRHGFAAMTVKEPLDHHVLLAGVASGRALALLPKSLAGLRRRGVVYRVLREGAELAVGIGLATRRENAAELRELLLAGATRTTLSRPLGDGRR